MKMEIVDTFLVIDHRNGYGSYDHLAEEVIDRVWAILGDEDAQTRIPSHVGMAAHSIPSERCGLMSIPATTENRAALQKALIRARRAIPCNPLVGEVATVRIKIGRKHHDDDRHYICRTGDRAWSDSRGDEYTTSSHWEEEEIWEIKRCGEKWRQWCGVKTTKRYGERETHTWGSPGSPIR